MDKTSNYSALDHSNQVIPLTRAEKLKDLGVWSDENLSLKDHMHDKINIAYMMLGLIKQNFRHLTMPVFILLYKRMVLFYYCCSVWAPYRQEAQLMLTNPRDALISQGHQT